MYTLDSTLLGTGTLSRAELIEAGRAMEKEIDGGTLADLQDSAGVDATLILAHMVEETGWGTSVYWKERNNPGGIGATDENPDGAYTFDTPRDGLIADVSHMLTYIYGNRNPMRDTDPRYREVVAGPNAGRIRTVGQLGNGVWASDANYANEVVGIANVLVARYHSGDGSTQSGKGGSMVPDQSYSLPVRLDLENNGHSFVDRPTNPDGRILAIVKHVTGGESLDGALTWNRNPNVKASAHFYIDKDGTVVQDVSLFNGAWANGVLDNDSLPSQFDEVKANGWNPNDFTISIEHVGNPDDPDFPTPAQLTADARLTADLCDNFRVPVDADHIIGHNRFDSVNRPNCPGPHWDFGADVRAVSRLLNGDGNGTSPSIPVGTTSGSGSPTGSRSVDGGSGTDSGNPGSSSGIPPMAGKPDGNGKQPDSLDGWGRPIANGIFVGDESNDGDGRGFTVRRTGEPGPGIRVGHGFYDKYTANGGFDAGRERYGDALCSEFAAAVVPGVVNADDPNQPVIVQVFDYAAFAFNGRDVIELRSGVLAAHWLATHGVPLPSDMHF